MLRRVLAAILLLDKLRLFNNSVFEWFVALIYLDSCFRRNDGGLRCSVIPAKAGIQKRAKT